MRRPKPSSLVVSALASAGLLSSALGLSACESLAKTLGFVKSPPDEYAVSQGPELVVPPDFALRPPGEQEGLPAAAEARELIFGAGSTGLIGEVSAGELALLREANATRVDPRIRAVMVKESPEESTEDGRSSDALLDWLESNTGAPGAGRAPQPGSNPAPGDSIAD